jgi:predicted RNase H-like HicB family nuclease
MNFRVECEQEEDGRWIAEVIDLPGVLASMEALAKRFGQTFKRSLFAS